MVSANNITRKQFEEAKERYPGLVGKISKPAKNGEDTLEQLDKFRYEEAPEKYCQPDPKDQNGRRRVIPLTAKDLQKLVAWKLKHGKFRPSLMKLASLNTEKDVSQISGEAFAMYEDDIFNIKGAVKKLSELRGIGPATASLLLSVHDPDSVLFFGDEVYWWLCCKGKRRSIKYNFKEQEELTDNFRALVGRLGEEIRALDVEKVGYVMLKGSQSDLEEPEVEGDDSEKSDDKVAEKDEIVASPVAVEKGSSKKGTSRKRKNTKQETIQVEPRRSKRIKS